jgi:rhamnogalacturonyl hydrolase YesR
MIKNKYVYLQVLLGLLLFAPGIFKVAAQKLPKKKDILATLTLTNSYFMKKWEDPGKPIVRPDKTRPANIWTRAVYYEGLMALYYIDAQKRYYDYAVLWGEKHKWQLRDGVKTRNADNQACGQTYIDLYLIDKKPERIEGIKANIDSVMASANNSDWSWIDALQMGMPVFARLGVLYNDNRYYEKMYDIYNYSKTVHGGNGLFNLADNLWWRDKDFVAPYTTPKGKACYWSRGNGWVVAALVRVLDIMPENAPHRQEYLDMYKKMMTALLPLQRTDGYWNVSLKDPDDFGGKELTGTSLFVYGMAWGINKGILDKNTYLPAVIKAWNAMSKECVHSDGKLGYVQSTGKEPKDGQPVTFDKIPDFEDFGLGCFLLGGSEVYKLKK